MAIKDQNHRSWTYGKEDRGREKVVDFEVKRKRVEA